MARDIDTCTEQLLCSLEEHVATVTLNRPEKRNALGDILTPALRAILLTLEADAEVRVVVITGAGKAFCSGGDVSSMSKRDDAPHPALEDEIRDMQQRQQALTLRLHELAKPTIAALPGAAAGAGMSIALACDLRIAGTSGFFAPGFGNIGLSGDYGGSWQLARIVGPAKAKEIYFTGRRVASDEALSLGLVNEVVPDDQLAARTRDLATTIAAGPPLAIRYMKQNINRAAVEDFKTCLDWEADRQIRCRQTDDHREAVAAFLAKRKPVFKGT